MAECEALLQTYLHLQMLPYTRLRGHCARKGREIVKAGGLGVCWEIVSPSNISSHTYNFQNTS